MRPKGRTSKHETRGAGTTLNSYRSRTRALGLGRHGRLFHRKERGDELALSVLIKAKDELEEPHQSISRSTNRPTSPAGNLSRSVSPAFPPSILITSRLRGRGGSDNRRGPRQRSHVKCLAESQDGSAVR